MCLKLLIILATYVFLVHGSDVERKENVESYITKEAAKELRNKLNAQGEQQDHDYDEILEKIIMSMHPNDNTAERVVFEKKYFDYLPNDLDSEDVTDEDVTHELDKDAVSPEHKIADENNARRVNSRRFRRDLSNESRRRRQNPMPSPFQTRYYARAPNPTSFLQNPTNLNTQSNTNQWAYNPKMFSGDRYLPPPNPEANVPLPPDNNNLGMEDIGNRVAGFEGEDVLPVWNAINRPPPRPQNQPDIYPQRPQYQPTTTTTTTTTARPYYPSNQNAIFGEAPKESEYELELPPSIFVDPKTTRAPLTRKMKTTTKATPQPTASMQYESRVTSSRKQNEKVPACVLAIVNCCSQYDVKIRLPCFEKYKCTGKFFGSNPCSPDTKAAAFREVEKFSQS